MKKWIPVLIMLLMFIGKKSAAQFVEASQCIGGNGNDIIVDVQKTSDSGLIVLVNTTSTDGDFSDNAGMSANVLIKLNSHYEIEWKKSYNDSDVIAMSGLSQFNQGYFIQYLSASLYIIDSSIVSATNYYNLICLDANGNKRWHKKYLADGTTSGSMFYYYLSLPLYQNIKVLRNNTIAFSTLADSTIQVHNVDLNGNTLWELSYNYDSLFRYSNSSGWGSSMYNTYDNSITELNDNTILLTNSLQDYCYWFCSPLVHKTHFINIDYNGTLIKENYADTSLSYISRKIKVDDDFIYFQNFGGNNIYIIDKNNLTFEQNYFDYGQIINGSSYFLNFDSTIQNAPLFLYTTFDSVNNYTKFYLQRADLINHSMLFQTLLDTSAVINYLGNTNAYALPDSEFVVFYSKNNEYRIVKINQSGTVVYNKLLSSSIPMNESISGYLPYSNYYSNSFLYRSFNIGYNNKFYSYNIWSNYDSTFNTINTQRFFIHNLENGELEYEFINDMRDTLVYKYISPYPDNKNELFVLSDLNGQNTCRLGGFDIMLSKVISATNKIIGNAYIDYNNNNTKDNEEPAYGLAYLESSKGNNSISRYMYGYDYTTNFVDTGTWITKILPHHNYYEVQPDSFIVSHIGFGNSDTVVFAMHPTRTINDLKISLVNTFISRLGSTTNYEIAYANEGTHTANGVVKLVLDNRLNFSNAIPAISSQNGDTLIWEFSNLQIMNTRKIIIQSNVPIPPDLQVGDTLYSIAFIEPGINDSTPNDNQATLEDVIPGSYDPNDKTSTSGEYISPAQIQRGDYITYVVRFQNTGNDTAFRIVIEDTLDANLDWSTLQPLNTSHPFSMQVVNKNIIQFTFSNMKLPPASINEPESHGFIAYKVRPKTDLAQGSTIKNTAHIYFDFNAPITTNTVNTQVVLLSSIKQNNKNEGELKVYPNPNNGTFNLEFSTNYTSPLTLELVDFTGRTVYQTKLQHQFKSIVSIQTDNLSSGLYAVVLKTDREQIIEKIIIDK
jgi:uncharacterized repeat protein (TIGR01451 family)